MLPEYIKNEVLDKENIPYVEVKSLEESLPELDVLYMTRVQGERFEDKDEHLRLRDSYILTPEKLVNAKPDMFWLHLSDTVKKA